MAARVFLRQGAVAPMAAGMLLGGSLLYPRTALAEAPESYAKKPIYDDYDAPDLIVAKPLPPSSPSAAPARHGPSPTDRLAGQIRLGRLFLYRQARTAEDGINRAADRVFGLERSLTETLAGLAPPRESGERLMPGAVYVLVAAMAGSIVTRRSNVLLRAAVPLAFGVGASWTLLPRTSRNVADLVWSWEQRVPALAQAHLQTRDALERAATAVRVHADLGKSYTADKVAAVRETVEDWVKKGK